MKDNRSGELRERGGEVTLPVSIRTYAPKYAAVYCVQNNHFTVGQNN